MRPHAFTENCLAQQTESQASAILCRYHGRSTMRHHDTEPRPTTSSQRMMLWFGCAVWLLGMSLHGLEFATCAGCSVAEAVVSTESCCTDGVEFARDAGGCCCCVVGEETEPDVLESAEGVDSDVRSGSSCCGTFRLEIGLAPLPTPFEAIVHAEGCPAAAAPVSVEADGFRAVARTRLGARIDRGPPRPDRCTALRACTVLLI